MPVGQTVVEWASRVVSKTRNAGIVPMAVYAYERLRPVSRRPRDPFRLYSKAARYPLLCRPGTSDIDVYRQIFLDREYRCLDAVRDPKLIVDCGANVGYSSAYFLSRFPSARVVAVEPDAGNFAVLQANLRPYGARGHAIQSGVWSHEAELVMSEAPFGDNRDWARTVREAKPGEARSFRAVDVGTLLQMSGQERISILKIDVEGSEREIFASNFTSWLERVDHLVIELHGEECARVFFDAIAQLKCEVASCDELTVCKFA